MANATRTKLTFAGETSIDRVKKQSVTMKDKTYERLTWSVKLPDGTVKKKQTLMPAGRTATLTNLRKKAKLQAEAMLAQYQKEHETPSEQANTLTFAAFIEQRSRRLIDEGELRESSRYEYRRALQFIVDELGEMSLAEGSKYLQLENALRAIADKHGATQAKRARTVLSRYVLDEAMKLEYIPANQIQGRQLNLPRPKSRTAGKGLSADDHERIVVWLLSPRDIKGFRASSVRKQENVILLTLIQAATGMRKNEVLSVKVESIKDDGAVMRLPVSAEDSKTHIGREPVVLDARVAERIRERIKSLKAGDYLVGSPASDATKWDRQNSQRAVSVLYRQIAEELGVKFPVGKTSHVWRTTLNMLLIDAPVRIRAAQFGHTEEMNVSTYTADADPVELMSTYGQR